MVISKEVIRSKDEFHVVWLMGSGDSKSISRRAVLSQNLPDICEMIIEMVPGGEGGNKEKIGLYLLSLLTRGTVLVHRHQVDYLQRDVERLREQMRKKSFLQLLAEKFDREQETRKVRESNKQRSSPIRCIEDVDDVNLENLPFISSELGIDADPRFIRIQDALPQWDDGSADLERLYGSVQPDSSQSSDSMHSTFVDGQTSNEHSKEKRSEVVDIRDILPTPNNVGFLNKRSAKIANAPVGEEHRPTAEIVPETIAEAQPMNEPPRIVPDLDIDYEMPPRDRNSIQDQLPLNHDIGNVPPEEQSRLADFFSAINSMPNDETRLPPMPNRPSLDNFSPPPAKVARLNEEEEEVPREKPRRNISSRPITPVNQTSVLHSTTRGDEKSLTEKDETRREAPVEQESLEFGPLDVLPTVDIPSRRRRLRRNSLHEDVVTQIDEAIRETLEADWTPLVRRREEVILIEPPTRAVNIADYMHDPRPSHRPLPTDALRLFKSCVFIPSKGHEDEKEIEEQDITEEPEKYGRICLISPDPLANATNVRDLFDEEYRPLLVENIDRNVPENAAEKTMEISAQPHTTEAHEPLKYWYTNLLPETRDRENIVQLIDELDLLPLPEQNRVIEDVDFSMQRNTDNYLENARHRQKSSIGLQRPLAEEMEIDSTEIERREEREKERLRKAIEAKDDGLFYYSSGSLLASNKEHIHKNLLQEAEEKYPDWLDFDKFTYGYNYKDAATAFDGLLLNLKSMKIRATQDEPFGKILVQHVPQDED